MRVSNVFPRLHVVLVNDPIGMFGTALTLTDSAYLDVESERGVRI